MSLSLRQEKILDFIRRFANDHGFPPTIREIGAAADISSTSVVNYNLTKLWDYPVNTFALRWGV